MATYNFALAFFPGNYDPQKDPKLHGPSAYVFVDISTTFSRSNKTFSTVITSECASYKEIEDNIERLKEELESIRIKAGTLFEKDKKRKLKHETL